MTIDKRTMDKAKKWAEGNMRARAMTANQASHPADAAAEVIRDLPDEWIDAGKLREVLDWRDSKPSGDDYDGEFYDRLRALISAPTPQVEIALGAWAMHPEHGKVLICSTRADDVGEVLVAWPQNKSTDGADNRWVTATDLSPLPDTQGDSEETQPEQADTTDTAPNPQRGEAWLIEVGTSIPFKTEAIRYKDAWLAVDQLGYKLHSGGIVTPLRRLVPAQEPRVLTTVEDYENAAVGTIAQAVHGIPREKLDDDEWGAVGSIRLLNNEEMAFSARTVLWEPEA